MAIPIRFDRLLTTGVVQPLLRAAGLFQPGESRRAAAGGRRLPILMYHSISEDREQGVGPYYRTATSPARFTEQMCFLDENDWQAVSLSDGLAWLRQSPTGGQFNQPQLPSIRRRPVAVTFDDGFRDFYSTAAPILRQFSFGATMFLPTAFVTDAGPPRQFAGRDCLSWPEVRDLHRAGFEFGSHTVTHPKLVDLLWTAVEAELADSKCAIEQRLGCAVPTFAYPYAFPQSHAPFVDRLRSSLAQCGYSACVTTTLGRATAEGDPFRLQRLPINGEDDTALFGAKLGGAYDWLAWPQRATKTLQRTLVRSVFAAEKT